VKTLYNKLKVDDYTLTYQDKPKGLYIDCGFRIFENATLTIALGQNVPENCLEYTKNNKVQINADGFKSHSSASKEMSLRKYKDC